MRCSTTATPSRSPATNAACKFWIGNIKHAATVGMVLARLVVDGQEQGHHWFRVPLRAKENEPPLPGITILSSDPKGGIQAHQVGGARFTGVRLPREALMARYSRIDADGRFSSTLPDANARFVRSIETFVQERVFPLSAGARAAELAAHLTWRFAGHRGDPPVAGPKGSSERTTVPRPAVPGPAALPRASWLVLDVLAACREMCGSQGFHSHNQIVTLRTDFEVNVTFAGDNSVMAYQVARNAARSPAFARPARTLAERVEQDLGELWRGRPDGSFTHDEAVTLVHARMLGLIMSEHDSDPQVPQPIMDDLVADFAVHRLGAVHRPLSAEREKIDFLAELLAPVPEIVSAPMVDDGYLAAFSRPA
nr:hypothetical protein [Kibdelosporangium sp. MJ126-NF4]CEL18104.1 Acyl-coenzyme A oxidase 1, peroxisomal [Kibdelosporangium sp. MJ126-NF4]CTQ90667.1 Acyl-coenzyme A oxidase 1, peroxisomal (EC 1.3.3.6) [Kibdelosporangium sp. MJ126-NF4]